jgi:hypothetical protein
MDKHPATITVRPIAQILEARSFHLHRTTARVVAARRSNTSLAGRAATRAISPSMSPDFRTATARERRPHNFSCASGLACLRMNPTGLRALRSITPRRSLRIASLRHGSIAWLCTRPLVAELRSASKRFPPSPLSMGEEAREERKGSGFYEPKRPAARVDAGIGELL